MSTEELPWNIHTRYETKMGKKYKDVRIVKNPQGLDPTFVFDHVEVLRDRFVEERQSEGIDNAYDKNQRLVEKSRRDSARTSRNNFRNKSKSAVSKQNHSPVYE